MISARKAKHLDITTMFTYSHANTPLGQSERAYYLRACLHGGGGPQVGEVTCLGGVTRLSIQSLILMLSRLHVRWGNPPHVTSPTWGPPPPCKQALRAYLHEGGGPQVGEVTCLGGVTRLSIQSLILMLSRLHVRWGNPPHVTSPTWGPPPSCK